MTDVEVKSYISVDSEICHGQPCFKGTRIMVTSILELLEAGESTQQILEEYPSLQPEHIQAALHLAAQVIGRDHYIAFTQTPA